MQWNVLYPQIFPAKIIWQTNRSDGAFWLSTQFAGSNLVNLIAKDDTDLVHSLWNDPENHDFSVQHALRIVTTRRKKRAMSNSLNQSKARSFTQSLINHELVSKDHVALNVAAGL